MTNLKLPKITLDRLLKLEVGEECEVILPIIRTDMYDMMKWCGTDEIVKNVSPLQPNEEFYVGEEFPCIGDCNMGIPCQTCGSNGQGIGVFEASQMTPEQSRFYGICVDVKVIPIREWLDDGIDISNITSHKTLVSQHNKLYGTNIEPSLDDYVFYLTVRRVR